MDLVLCKDRVCKLEQTLQKELLNNGVEHAFLVDHCGNLIIESGTRPIEDILPLAALSAANFGATERMAQLIGEDDFTLLFHKGAKHNIHFSRVGKDFILVALFGNDVALGLIRLGSRKAAEQILSTMEG